MKELKLFRFIFLIKWDKHGLLVSMFAWMTSVTPLMSAPIFDNSPCFTRVLEEARQIASRYPHLVLSE